MSKKMMGAILGLFGTIGLFVFAQFFPFHSGAMATNAKNLVEDSALQSAQTKSAATVFDAQQKTETEVAKEHSTAFALNEEKERTLTLAVREPKKTQAPSAVQTVAKDVVVKSAKKIVVKESTVNSAESKVKKADTTQKETEKSAKKVESIASAMSTEKPTPAESSVEKPSSEKKQTAQSAAQTEAQTSAQNASQSSETKEEGVATSATVSENRPAESKQENTAKPAISTSSARKDTDESTKTPAGDASDTTPSTEPNTEKGPVKTEPQASVTKYVEETTVLFIRQQPTVDSQKMGKLTPGTKVSGVITDGWMKLDDGKGYVSADYLTDKAPDPVPDASKIQMESRYTFDHFMHAGVIFWKGYRFTYYSERILPGQGLRIPGRHHSPEGYVLDGDGYVVLANDAPRGTIIPTPFGYYGKVYDAGTYGNLFDVYVK